MSFGRRASTDLGTVALHWVIVAFFAAVALSGLRIASDDPGLQWLAVFDAVLPVEKVWLIHLLAGSGLAAALVAYSTYMIRSRLLPRIKTRYTRSPENFRSSPSEGLYCQFPSQE